MELPFELLSDPERTLIKAWGLFNPFEAGGIAIPSVFVIDAEGVLRFRSLEKPNHRVEVSQLVDFVDTLAKEPGQTADHRDLARVGMSPSSVWRALKNIASHGDGDDWKHILLFPWEMARMLWAKRQEKQ